MTIARVCQFIDHSRLSPGAGGDQGPYPATGAAYAAFRICEMNGQLLT